MNCCEQNAPGGGCNQGRDCPVRRSTVKPAHIKSSYPVPTQPLSDIPCTTTADTAMFAVVVIACSLFTLVTVFGAAGYAWTRWFA